MSADPTDPTTNPTTKASVAQEPNAPFNPQRWYIINKNGQVDIELFGLPVTTMIPTHFRLSDPFHPSVTRDRLDSVFAMMAATPRHTFQVVTYFPDRAAEYFASVDREDLAWRMNREILHTSHHGERIPWPLPNVWMGTHVTTQTEADDRLPILANIPAVVRFISAHPVNQIEIWPYIRTYPNEWECPECRYHLTKNFIRASDGAVGMNDSTEREVCPNDGKTLRSALPRFHWVTVGDNSREDADPLNPNHVRLLQKQTVDSNLPFCFVGWGPWIGWEWDNLCFWKSGRGDETDSHRFPDFNESPTPAGWKDEWYTDTDDVSDGYDIVFEHVGLQRAGRLLDGQEWLQYPGWDSVVVAPNVPNVPDIAVGGDAQ